MANRKEFEKWISALPFEKSIERFSEKEFWPGDYKSYEVELAWDSWQEVSKRALAEIKKLRSENDMLKGRINNLRLQPKTPGLPRPIDQLEPFYEKHSLEYEHD